MTNIAPNETVTLIIGKAEALMLFDLLFDFYRQPTLEIKDDAQRLALVRVHGALESTLVEPFSKDYGEIISAARRDLLQQWAIDCPRYLKRMLRCSLGVRKGQKPAGKSNCPVAATN